MNKQFGTMFLFTHFSRKMRLSKKLKIILYTRSILTIRVMAHQLTPENHYFSNVWTRRAALRAAPVKETNLDTKSEASEPQIEPVNLATAFDDAKADDDGFVCPSAENHKANLVRMQRKAERAAQPRAPRMIQPKAEVQKQEKKYVPLSFAPFRPKMVENLQQVQTVAAEAAVAEQVAPAEKQQNTYTVVFEEKVTAGLTYERLHKATKADLVIAQEMVYNQFIEVFEYALKNDGLLQCVDHLAGGFQTRKFVDGKPIVAGKHTFLMSDIIQDQYWVRKTRKTLNEIEPRLRVSFYYDHRTSKGVLVMKKP